MWQSAIGQHGQEHAGGRRGLVRRTGHPTRPQAEVHSHTALQRHSHNHRETAADNLALSDQSSPASVNTLWGVATTRASPRAPPEVGAYRSCIKFESTTSSSLADST
jgi:hypothetical protein